MNRINPYVAGNPVGGTEKFIGREDILSEVWRILANPNQNAIVLYGQRRIGKTSILKELRKLSPHKGPYIPVYFDLEDRAALPLEQVLSDLAQAIAQAIALTASPNLLSLQGAGGQMTPDAFLLQFLPRALDALLPNTSLVLLFDEFDELGHPQASQAAKIFFPYLRRLMNLTPQKLQFVFAIGRQFEDLTDQMVGVLKEVEPKRVSLLTRDDAVHLVRLSERNKSLLWHERAIDRVWDLTHGHPYLTQQLCAVVWDKAHQGTDRSSKIEQGQAVWPEMIDDDVISKLFERSASSLQWIWDGLPSAARFVASVLAEAGPDVLSPEELESTLTRHGVQVIMRQLRSAPQTLKNWDIVEQVNGGYRFRVELLRQWFVRYKPLALVQEELANIEPVANTLYRIGQQEHQAGELAEAARLLRRAVQINPNHIKARLVLAKVLLKEGASREAIAELRIAYEQEPSQAQSDYVTVLLKLAQSQDKSLLERWDACQQILQIDPAHPSAQEILLSLALQIGEEALARDEFDTALKFFKEAQQEDRVREVKGLVSLKARELRVQKAEEYEAAGDWVMAIQLYEQLRDEFPTEVWQERIQRAQQQEELTNLYQQAQGALREGQNKEAVQILSHILSEQPSDEQADTPIAQALRQGLPEGDVTTNARLTGSRMKWGIGLISLLVVLLVVWSSFPRNLAPIATPTDDSATQNVALGTSTAEPSLTTVTEIDSADSSPTATATRESERAEAKPTFTVTAQAERTTPDPVLETPLPSNSGSISEFPDKVVVLEPLTKHTDEVWSLDFSPDGYLLASGAHDNQIALWDADKGYPLSILTELTDSAKVWSIDFSPDGTFLASGSEDGRIRLWDVVGGEVVQSFTAHSATVRSVAFHPDGTRLVSGADDNTVRLWDLATSETLQTFTEATDWVLSVAVSPNGRQIASGDADNTIYLWKIDSQQAPQRLTGHTDWVRSIAFSPDGKRLASASNDNTVRLWNLADGEVQAVLGDHTKNVNSVAFSPDGTLLLSGADDNSIRLWDVESGALIQTWQEESGRVRSVAFNSDGTRLASGSESGTILLWGVPTE